MKTTVGTLVQDLHAVHTSDVPVATLLGIRDTSSAIIEDEAAGTSTNNTWYKIWMYLIAQPCHKPQFHSDIKVNRESVTCASFTRIYGIIATVSTVQFAWHAALSWREHACNSFIHCKCSHVDWNRAQHSRAQPAKEDSSPTCAI